MLSLFASNAADTKMDAANLAIVFSPGILSHPQHRSPVQYRISQRVLEFLIEFQALFTMQLLSAQIIPEGREGSSMNNIKKSKGGVMDNNNNNNNNGAGVPPVPPLPKKKNDAFVDPRATKSDPLLPLSPQPVRPIPRQLFADIPMDEKTQEKDDTRHVESVQQTIQQQQKNQQEEQSTFPPSARPRSAGEEDLHYTSLTTTKRPTDIDQQRRNEYDDDEEEEEDDDYDAPTPRAMSPIRSSSPCLTEKEIEQPPPKDLLQELKSIRDTLLHMLPGK